MTAKYSAATDVHQHGIVMENEAPPVSEFIRIATTKLPLHSRFTVSILDLNQNSLNERAVHLANVNGPHAVADYYEEEDLRYCALATLYHLNQIIDYYVENSRIFERYHATVNRGNIDDPRVFYEIDAFLGAARRVYESIRKVLWKHYDGHNVKGRWSSIRKVSRNPRKTPSEFLNALQLSWESIGRKLKAYRDCISHYDPLTDGATTCWAQRFGDKWGIFVKLPANPEVPSRRNFDFVNGPDALTYCHSVACGLIDLCESLEKQSTIRSYLDHPQNIKTARHA